MGRLEGLRCVVTGASRGLGRALAEGFAAEGARVVVTASRRGHLDAVCRAIGDAAVPVELDLGDPAAVAEAARAVVLALGRVDVLVNNAGLLGTRTTIEELPADELEQVTAVNLVGTVRFTQAILPAMSHGAAIVNVSSGAAGRGGWGAYAMTKGAVNAFTDMLRAELADREIRCVAVNPGGIRTAMRAAAYPQEDPATVPHPRAVVEPFIAIAEGADPGPRLEAQQWAP